MKDKVISAALAYVLTSWIIGVVIGYSTIGSLIAFVLGVAAGVAAYRSNYPITERLRSLLGSGTEGKGLVQPAGTKITIYGETIDRPAFLNSPSGFFGWKHAIPAYFRTTKGEIERAGIPPLRPNALNERRLFESMLESARFEMLRRGVAIRNRLNRNIFPEIYDQGLLIESVALDDGSTAHILAVGLSTPLDRDSWLQACQAGIGRGRSSWDDRPYATVTRWRTGIMSFAEFTSVRGGVMPLFELQLTEIISPPAEPDPLAEAGVSIDYPSDLPRG